LAGAKGELALEIAVRAGPEDPEGDEGGLVIIPEGIAGGLIGGIGGFVGPVNRLANCLGGLKALENGVENESDFRLGGGPGNGKEQEKKQAEPWHF
jgi:hypothetical protein